MRLVVAQMLFVPLLTLLPVALASATSQFKLDHQFQASNCYIECHHSVASTMPLPNAINDPTYISANCKSDSYLSLMSTCIAQSCLNAPDAAYAVEYSKTFCERSGVQAQVALPQWYLDAAAEYFESEGYLASRGTRGMACWGTGWLLVIALIAYIS